MNVEQFKQVVKEKLAECEVVLVERGKHYAGDDDMIRNFKQTSELMNVHGWRFNGMLVTPELVCQLLTMIKVQRWANRIREGQDPEDDYTDGINYILLGMSCRKETPEEDYIYMEKVTEDHYNIYVPKDMEASLLREVRNAIGQIGGETEFSVYFTEDK